MSIISVNLADLVSEYKCAPEEEQLAIIKKYQNFPLSFTLQDKLNFSQLNFLLQINFDFLSDHSLQQNIKKKSSISLHFEHADFVHFLHKTAYSPRQYLNFIVDTKMLKYFLEIKNIKINQQIDNHYLFYYVNSKQCKDWDMQARLIKKIFDKIWIGVKNEDVEKITNVFTDLIESGNIQYLYELIENYNYYRYITKEIFEKFLKKYELEFEFGENIGSYHYWKFIEQYFDNN